MSRASIGLIGRPATRDTAMPCRPWPMKSLAPNGRAAYRSPILTARVGGYLSTVQARAEGVSRVWRSGVKLWALRIAYERTGDPKYLASAELFMQRWVRVRAEDHSFTGTVRAFERFTPPALPRSALQPVSTRCLPD